MFSSGRNVSRAVVSAGLGLAMGISAFVPCTVALAATGGSVTIQSANPAVNRDASYSAYRLFTADVTEKQLLGGTIDEGRRFEWNEAYKSAVLTYLDSQGYGDWLTSHGYTQAVNGVAAHDLPQNAAEFISEKIDGSADSSFEQSGNPRAKVGSSFARGLANAVASSGVDPTVGASGFSSGSDGVTMSGQEQGYYLIVTDLDSLVNDATNDPESGTAPIWVGVSASDKTVVEKSSAMTFKKEVLDESGSPVKLVDLATGQMLNNKSTVRLPDSLDTYATYPITYKDPIPAGLSVNPDDVVVTVGEGDNAKVIKPTSVSINQEDNTLTVVIDDLLNAKDLEDNPVTVNPGDQVFITYPETVTDAVPVGSSATDGIGSPAGASLTYVADPTTGTTRTVESNGETRLVNYQLSIDKVDESTRNALDGAGFTLRVADNANADLVGKYVSTTGALVDYSGNADDKAALEQAGILHTCSDAHVDIPHIDQGTYTLHEAVVPDGYKGLDSDVTVTIVATAAEANPTVVGSLKATVTGGNASVMGSHEMDSSDSVAAHEDGYLSSDANTGVISIRVSDSKEIYLPGTGLTPNAAMMIGGAIVMAVGATIFIRQRKMTD